MKHILLYESYHNPLNQQYGAFATEIPSLRGDYERVASSYIDDLKKNYYTGKGKEFNKKIGNSSWYTKDFFRWCEIARMPCQIIYFPATKKAKDEHVAAYIDGWVIDFAHKQFSKNKKEEFKVSKKDLYKKYGYDVSKAEIFDEFPDWIEGIYPPRSKK